MVLKTTEQVFDPHKKIAPLCHKRRNSSLQTTTLIKIGLRSLHVASHGASYEPAE